MKFAHTADWQLGKPFARVSDPDKRALARQARIDAISRVGIAAQQAGAEFVLVAGDLFDSPSADKATVVAACSAIGQIGLPVLVLPGNHDHAGPGSTWHQDFFQREREALAPNLELLVDQVPRELPAAIILPCPLLTRAAAEDPTEWLRSVEVFRDLPASKPRIVLAHGSTQVFCERGDDEGEAESTTDWIDISRIQVAEVDYVALGDWHGAVQVTPKCWYSGSPEPDRFPKAIDYDSGNILIVDVERGGIARVEKARTAALTWSDLSFDFAADEGLDELRAQIGEAIGQRVNRDFLRLSLSGSLGMTAVDALDSLLESVEARVLRLKLNNRTLLAPTQEEIDTLTCCSGDPLIASVAQKLAEQLAGGTEEAQLARVALRELFSACSREVPR